jgi:hypothetical protein
MMRVNAVPWPLTGMVAFALNVSAFARRGV